MPFQCSVTGLILTKGKCPVNNCMWWNGKKKTGCSAGHATVDAPPKVVNSAKMRISAMLVLDRYCEWVRVNTRPRAVNERIEKEVRDSDVLALHPIFHVTVAHICELCKMQNWKQFKKDSNLMLRVDLTKVLGLRNKQRQAIVKLYATLAVSIDNTERSK